MSQWKYILCRKMTLTNHLLSTCRLPWGSWWCCCRSFVVCCWGCSPAHPARCCKLPEYVGSVSPDPDESAEENHCMCELYKCVTVICWSLPILSYWIRSECKEWRTSDPNMSFLSWMRIHPILQPGTSQRLAKPPQERMGTSLLRDAKEGQLQPGKTWGKEQGPKWNMVRWQNHPYMWVTIISSDSGLDGNFRQSSNRACIQMKIMSWKYCFPCEWNKLTLYFLYFDFMLGLRTKNWKKL